MSLGNVSFEIEVRDRMIFDLHGQPLVGRIERRPLGNGPGFENAFHLESEVIVPASGFVLLDNEAIGLLLLNYRRKLWGLFEPPLTLVFFEGHGLTATF